MANEIDQENKSKVAKLPKAIFIIVAALPFAFSLYVLSQTQFPMYLYAIMSIVCFAAYALDKWKAKKEKSRIPEKVLHLLELLFGWPGALLAQRLVRHKNRKVKFQMVFWGIVILHILGWMAYLSYLQTRVV